MYVGPVNEWVQVGEPEVQRHRGKWVVRQLGYDPATGRRGRSNLAPLQVSARPRLASGPSSKDEWGTDAETVGEFMQQAWLPSKEGRVENSTLDQYVWAVKRHIVPLLGAVRLRDLTAELVDRWISTLTAPDADGKPRLGATSAGHHATSPAASYIDSASSLINGGSAPARLTVTDATATPNSKMDPRSSGPRS